MSTLWTFVFIGFVVIGLSIYCTWYEDSLLMRTRLTKPRSIWKIHHVIQATIVVIYFALPLVVERIFDALKCRAFNTNDNETPSFESYH